MLTERQFISVFNVLPTRHIEVRTTLEISRDDVVVSQSYQRYVLAPHDPQAESVLGAEPYYLALAETAWADVSVFA